MRTINIPPPDAQEVSAKDSDTCMECSSEHAYEQLAPLHSQPLNIQAAPIAEMNRLFRQMELKLESVVDRLLVSKIGENDNVLASVQGIMERIFVRSAMRMAEGNISRAAKLLGINRNTLSKKLRAIETRG